MKPRVTLVLLALAAALWALWFLVLNRVPGTKERRDMSVRLVARFDPGETDRLTLERPDGRLEIARAKDGGWAVEAPFRDAAEKSAVESLLDAVKEERIAARVPLAEVQGGEAATGLGTAAARLTVRGKGPAHSVVLGAADAPGNRRYARVDDAADVALVDRKFADGLLRRFDDFRAHDLLSVAPVGVSRWTVERAGVPALAFERREGENWWITAPIIDAADDTLVGGILSRIVNLRADRFLDAAGGTGPVPAPDAMGLAPPRTTVRLCDSGGKIVARLELGNDAGAGGQVYGRVDGRPAPFQVSLSGLAAELAREPRSFRSTLALDVSVYDVAEFTLERGGATVRVKRTPATKDQTQDTWTAVEPPGAKVDTKKAAEVITGLARIEGSRIADDVTPEAAGLSRPAARLTIVGSDARRLPRTAVEFGGPAGDGVVYARRAGRPTILVVPLAAAQKVDPLTLTP